jgi:hypothetical protein
MVYRHTDAVVPSFADEILYRFVIYEESGGTRIGVDTGLTRLKISAEGRSMLARWRCGVSCGIVPKVLICCIVIAPRERDSCGPERRVFDRLPGWQVEDKATEIGCITEPPSHSVGGTHVRLLLTRLMSVPRGLAQHDAYRQVFIRLGCHLSEILIILPLVDDHCEVPLRCTVEAD